MPMYTVTRPARSVFLPIRNQRYHVHEWGAADAADAPTLILLHGWMDVGASYQFLVDALAVEFVARRHIVAPDWRGFGRTTGPACDHYAFADYLGDLEALVDHYAAGRAIDLVGHSMGGNVAMMYAGTRPERVRRLVNLEGFGLPRAAASQAPARYAQWLDEIAALARGEKELRTYASPERVAERLRKTNPRLAPDKAAWVATQWAAPRTDADGQTRWHILGDPAHRVSSARLFNADEMIALYAAITAPTLVVEASASSPQQWWQGRYTLEEFHQRLRSLRDVRVETVAAAGHMVHHDQPEVLARLMEDFLDPSARDTPAR